MGYQLRLILREHRFGDGAQADPMIVSELSVAIYSICVNEYSYNRKQFASL